MSKHTPGPWIIVDTQRGDAIVNALIDESGAAMYGPIVDGGIDTEANARLIAAAPELLAACEAVIEEQSIGMYGAISNECIAQLRAAVAKATEA